jgi:hypothetical protein
MNPVLKRPKLVNIIPSKGNLDAFALLTQVEVQDAMNFAIASGGDVRFSMIVEVMRNDKIWQFWFQRDLKIVHDTKWKWPFESVETPAWKTYYLWWRLVISCFQYSVLKNEQILAVYPEDSKVRFVRLNELELKTPKGEVIMLDFRREYPRYITASPAYRPNYGIMRYQAEDLWLYSRRLWLYSRREDIDDFLTFKYPSFDGYAKDEYIKIIRAMFDSLEPSDGKFYSRSEYLQAPPRLITATKLLVASPCVTCDAEPRYCETTNAGNVFCSKSCQRRFHLWK